MAVTPGTRLGVYEVTALIGEGGMGQVYRATDTRLKRQVAIKILPPSFVADADRVARFQHEAEVLASLNHPLIAAIYGIEESQDVRALVMELVEGEDLSQRIGRGAIPLDEALPIAKQIAEALEAAHEQGIIHRDLKPANVKVRPDGTVKVLDFGLAKALDSAAAASSSASLSPTLSLHATMAGVILGTAAYMSPEQAAGRPVDCRTDVWSYGVVLWEMLTGRCLFEGETVSHTLAGVLRAQIEFDKLPSTTPRAIRDVAKRCLDRDVKTRLRDIGEARVTIQKYLSNPAEEAPAAVPSARPASIQSRVAWAVAALALVGLVTVSDLLVRATAVEQRRVHLTVPLPGNTAALFFALSPDGRSLVMSQGRGLVLRSLESGEIRALIGTQFARSPFWSPDSRTIAFFAPGDRTLKTVAASGGPARTLCGDVGTGLGGTWNRAGTIVFATGTGVLSRVSAAGGPCTELAKPEPGVSRAAPVFLPDGDHFFYVLATPDEARQGVYVASLGDSSGRRLQADRSSAVFVPNGPGSNHGRLLFVREQTLMAQAFDATSLQLSGEPVKVADQVSFTASGAEIAASADTNGTLIYLTNSRPDRQLVWYDRSGKELGRGATTGSLNSSVSLSPDGKRVAFGRNDAQDLISLWVHDLERNQETPLTTPPLRPGAPVWSPDSQRVVFRAVGSGAIYVKNVNGGNEEILLQDTNPQALSDWSRDDRWLVYTQSDPKTGSDIWILADPSHPSADHKPVALLRTTANESQGQISPDGKWLAYYSDESGTGQIFLRPFAGASPAPETKWQVSTVPSREPRWRADSKELFYVEPVLGTSRIKVMSVPIGAAPQPAGTPRSLFEFRSQTTVPQQNWFLYAPAADGQRFLVNVFATEAEPSLEVIVNWGRTPVGK